MVCDSASRFAGQGAGGQHGKNRPTDSARKPFGACYDGLANVIPLVIPLVAGEIVLGYALIFPHEIFGHAGFRG